MKSHKVRDLLYRELGAVLPGFKPSKKDEAFVRAIPGGLQKIFVPIIDYNPGFRFSLVFGIRLDEVEVIYNQFSAAPAGTKSLTTLTQLAYFFPKETKKQIAVASEEEIVAAVRSLSSVIEGEILPFLGRHQNVKSLDAAMNGEDPRFDKSDPLFRNMHALILAQLARNPNLDELVAKYAEEIRWFPEASKAKFVRLTDACQDIR